ncbi:putative uncharacterized protein DDB_G0287113 [Sorghum bicolor]|uniref:putative uncharacterized protein DDB_G0287113 n=1 Tax=Sorghum bicolor TaxID=4558 RepID=UPI000B424B2C|nr:putative uncharacterized protein DDB_G0287113 [Sorghum bicolor]|eukprot:XP_021321663.1 putative uncharacterized protein DDB_G0287113 [Sorghum bicolor]
MSNEVPVDNEVAARVRATVVGDFQPGHVNGFPMRPDQGSIDLGSIDARSSKPPVEDDVDRDKRRESAEKLKLKRLLEQTQPSIAKKLKVGAASKDSGSSDPRPSTGVESAPPRPLVGESTPPSSKQRKKEEEERERETQQQLQEGQQKPQQEGEEGEEGRRQQGDQLKELLDQDRQQELRELQRQQRQKSQ